MILSDGWSMASTLTGGVATIAIFSFLLGENRLYRFFEHLFIGIAAAWGLMLTLKNFLWPKILEPVLGLDIMQYPDGSYSMEYPLARLLYLIPFAFGLLYYCMYSQRYNWLAKLVIGFSLGAGAGLAFEGILNQMLPQLSSSFKSLVAVKEGAIDWRQSFDNVVFVYTLLAVMYYFFFSFRRRGPVLGRISASGRWFMMVCFGAYFGSTVMARMALLVERLQFLLGDWCQALMMLGGR